MPTPRKLYIDADGVERGYYVYLHKDRVTGEVFYVGKGHGRRAWNREARSDEWKKKVALLSEGWDVEIVQDSLSEIEAFELEAELVEKYGGAAATGGKLMNWVPGGEEPAGSITIEFPFDDKGWSTAYYEARKFKALARDEQEGIATFVDNKLEPLADQLSGLEDEADENEDETLSDSVSNVEIIIGSVLEASSDFLRRRVSWKDLGFAIEDARDDLEGEMEDAAEYHPKAVPLLKRAFVAVHEAFTKIDSGNREEAEELANRTAQGK